MITLTEHQWSLIKNKIDEDLIKEIEEENDINEKGKDFYSFAATLFNTVLKLEK
jgi:hypothetical protein